METSISCVLSAGLAKVGRGGLVIWAGAADTDPPMAVTASRMDAYRSSIGVSLSGQQSHISLLMDAFWLSRPNARENNKWASSQLATYDAARRTRKNALVF